MSKTNIGPHQHLLLDQFGQLVYAAWGAVGYRVGSSVRDGETWRDIDIRVMLDTQDWERRFQRSSDSGDEVIHESRHRHPGWRAEMLAWATLGERITGLPIDFQVEQADWANEAFPTEPRNPIGFGIALQAISSAVIERNLV